MGVLSNPGHKKKIYPDDEIPDELLKKMGTDRVKQLESQHKISDQPKSAKYAIVAKNTQKALKKVINEKSALSDKIVSLSDELTKAEIKIAELAADNKSLKGVEAENKKLLKQLEKKTQALETMTKQFAEFNKAQKKNL